ncbi:MAG: hypothetical protein D6731_00650 [Planctomycetota bacterium]|nr:MAG: hypothetical protein D6731_00650 [Planctomycetota bacterium]
MGLGKWFNRYILEVQREEGEPPADPERSPEEAARTAPLVPTRPAREVIEDLPQPTFTDLEAELEARRAARGEKDRPSAASAAPADDASVANETPTADDGCVAAETPTPPAPARDPLDDGGPPPVTVEQVYAAAKLKKPLHGFTLEKVAAMLSDPRLESLDERSRANAVAVMLDAAGVKVTEILRQAAERDGALDRFEGFLTDKLISLEVALEKENSELEAEIERLIARKREQLEKNRQRLLEKERELARFRRVKRAEEERLFEVVRHFTTDNPVSITALGEGPHSPEDDEEPPAA